MTELKEQTQYLEKLIETSSYTVAFTGAGISTASGIPDYRGPDGVWTKNPELMYAPTSVDDLRETLKGARPNAGHNALFNMWYCNSLAAVITQNVDRLHQGAGLPDSAVIELHGSGDNIIGFNQNLDKLTWRRAEQEIFKCELLIVLGSSLQVYPAANLVDHAQYKLKNVVIVNNQPTPYDAGATLVIRHSISEVMAMIGWC